MSENKILTAKEVLDKNLKLSEYGHPIWDENSVIKAMIEFAQLHIGHQKTEIFEKLRVENTSSEDELYDIIDESYPQRKYKMINVDKYQEELNTLQKKMNWLIDGYFINCLLPFTEGKFIIPNEFIIENYNTDLK